MQRSTRCGKAPRGSYFSRGGNYEVSGSKGVQMMRARSRLGTSIPGNRRSLGFSAMRHALLSNAQLSHSHRSVGPAHTRCLTQSPSALPNTVSARALVAQ